MNLNFAQVWQSLIVCEGPDCGFDDLIRLAGVVMNNIIVLSIVASTIAFIWIGFTLLTSGGDVGAKEKAKNAAWSVVKGLFFVLAGWLIVYTISSVLLNEGFSIIRDIQ